MKVMTRFNRSTAHQFMLDESSANRAISSLQTMLVETHGGGAMLSLLSHIARSYRMTAAKLEAAEKRLSEIEAECQ